MSSLWMTKDYKKYQGRDRISDQMIALTMIVTSKKNRLETLDIKN